VGPSQRSGVLSISASYEGTAREVGFTLTAYARPTIKMSWVENQPAPPYSQKVGMTSYTIGQTNELRRLKGLYPPRMLEGIVHIRVLWSTLSIDLLSIHQIRDQRKRK